SFVRQFRSVSRDQNMPIHSVLPFSSSCILATYRFGAAVNLDLDWRWRATDKPSDDVMDANLRAVHFKNSWAASRSSVSDKSHGKLRSTTPDRCSRKASLLSFFDLDFL